MFEFFVVVRPIGFCRQVPDSGDRMSGLMLRVTTIHASSAAKSAAYYTQYLTAAPGEVPGVWCGRQAAGLGLSGTVEAEPLELLLSGRDPVSGTPLGRELVDRVTRDGRVIKAVSGFDATFSAPLSGFRITALMPRRRLCRVGALGAVVAGLVAVAPV